MGPYHGETSCVTIHRRHFISGVDYLCHFGSLTSSPARFLWFDPIECNSPEIGKRRSNLTHDFHVKPQLKLLLSEEEWFLCLVITSMHRKWYHFSIACTSPLVVVGDVGQFREEYHGTVICASPAFGDPISADSSIALLNQWCFDSMFPAAITLE